MIFVTYMKGKALHICDIPHQSDLLNIFNSFIGLLIPIQTSQKTYRSIFPFKTKAKAIKHRLLTILSTGFVHIFYR